MSSDSVSEIAANVDSAVLMREQGKLESTWKNTAAAKLLASERGKYAIRIPRWLSLTIRNPIRVRVMSRIVNRFDSGRVMLRGESVEEGDTPCIKTSCRQLAGEIGCDHKTIKSAINWLSKQGFITLWYEKKNPRRGGWLVIRLSKACPDPDQLRAGREAYVKDWVHLAVGKDAAMSWFLSQLLYFEGKAGGVERDGKHWHISSPGQFRRRWGMERSVARRAIERLKKLGVIEVALYPYKPRQSKQAPTSHIRVVPEKLEELLSATKRDITALIRLKQRDPTQSKEE
jgi:DNA-binding MarR family transcriptional regulator